MENEKVASMDDVLSGETETTEEIIVEDAVTDDKETEETKPADDVEKEETKPEASSAPETQVPMSAMKGERDRRQAAEKERDELRIELNKISDTPPTSVFEDEVKFNAEIDARIDRSALNVATNQSEFYTRREFGSDVMDQKIEIFKGLIKDNNELYTRFVNATSPYHELVTIVDQHDELDKMKDIEAYKATLRAEAKVDVKKELEKEAADKLQLRDSIPDSLVGDPSKGGLDSKTAAPAATAEDLYDP